MEAAPVERHEQLAPMWVVHMQNLLNMKCLQNHQELRKAGLIVECQATFLSIFVSHQWLGKGHPDKTGAQFKILQEALANIIDGFTKIELDLPMQFTGETTVLSSANREQLRNAYVWFDWFSIPQIEVKSGGNDSEEMSSHVFLSVQSIPFYVESCKLFLALVPTLPHNDFEDVSCNYCTWLDRGWCRLEIWCNLLSHNREAPMILVRDADQAEFAMPIHWVHSSAQEGNFAVESDREKVAQVMRTAFRSKLASLKGNREQVDLFRYLAAVQYRLLQLPRPSLSLESFVDHFGFEKPELTASQGMVPLACAVLSEDLEHHLPQPSPRAECLLQLIIAQLAVLLQLTQLWTVLGDLAPAVETAANVAPVDDSAQGDPLLGYLEALQFTSSELQNFLALQCVYDGVTVRSLFALATPLVPLLLLIACGCGEVFSRGLGIRIGLKTLTVLFIGGASGSAQLLGCQGTDGAGAALKEFAFRPLFPHERCDEALWVDRIGWATAICYGLVIPCFLGFLFAKQNVVMRKVKTAVMQTARNEGKVIVRLQGLESEQSFKDATLSKRLLAGAAACVAVDGKGRALVEVQNDAVIVTPTTNISRASEDLGVESLVFGADVKEAEVLQRHVMAQMLMERSILEQETDRVMLGAKELFCKYAKCENVWMEACTKVASAALVSVVAVDNLWLCVTITLGMALVIGLAQPFAQPQINVLQSACFGCLALAAVGFRHHLARLALAVPFVLLVLQLRRPDSPEMLALRLQQELEAKIHEGPVEVSSEQFT